MANSRRRAEYTDRMGNMFIPMNVDTGSWNEHFINTPKLICIVGIIGTLIALIIYLNSSHVSILGYIIVLGFWFIVSMLITRFIIFEEKFYYKMYLELKEHEIATPALFWDIASIKDNGEGAIMTYSDAKIAVMIKVDRDTITGKSEDFRETHFDAISDFYKEVVTNKYMFVQMNIMEHAGKDPRLNQLSQLLTKSDNENICRLMELEIGHIKNLVHKSLYESDYFLFYTYDVSKIDTIMQDCTDFIYKLMDGAYISYSILSREDIVDFIKEEYGVNYFNSTEASLLMFNKDVNTALNPFNISGILWTDGENQKLNNRELNRLRSMTSGVINGTMKKQKMSLKDTIYRKDNKNRIGIDFNSLDEDTSRTKKKQQKPNVNKPKEQVVTKETTKEVKETQEIKKTQETVTLTKTSETPKINEETNKNNVVEEQIKLETILEQDDYGDDDFIDL